MAIVTGVGAARRYGVRQKGGLKGIGARVRGGDQRVGGVITRRRLFERTGVRCRSSSGSAFGWNGLNATRPRHPALIAAASAVPIDAVTEKLDEPEEVGEDEDALSAYVRSRGGKTAIRKVLVANNGMAATKCIMSMRRWAFLTLGDDKAIQFVCMATPEDLNANSEYIRLADDFVQVPGGGNANNYANVQLIVDIAVKEGVDAVWPGWGHASENPKLPESLKAKGITFIGPTSPVMSVLGDKIAANILAQTANVPSIPWSGDGLTAELTEEGTIPDDIFNKAMVHSVEEAVAAAARIGYPVMLKASEGGGGKGIRKSTTEAELRTNYDQVCAEVPGSPVFMMQLCTQARHLEVQIVGDEYGNAVALNGRDCSTQRRFQKIFEEGPPTIAPREIFREMEKSAQRLTQSIGYRGAGTVEYLFNAATGSYYFLELNPRLQVEHPVTEGITGINLPAAQLQVAMGIPLYRNPQVRQFYGKDAAGDSPINFLDEDYVLPTKHVIAARITAENPDEGFKPTSGSIERINFQSMPDVWGYFSVGANGGVHEFADSQFGHLFATGTSREEARKSLIFALKEMIVRGEIRTAVEYLVKLLETKDFRSNTIDTSWLDGLIANKDISVSEDTTSIVCAAAVYRAHNHIQDVEEEVFAALNRGQKNMDMLESTMSFPIEVVYESVRYQFDVTRLASDSFRFKVGESLMDARVREQSDGTLLAQIDGVSSKISGVEEPLGLRLTLNGHTVLLPTQFDPSELRTDVTGKLLRFLQPDGAQIEKGQSFAEMEAMKMVMPMVAQESGIIRQNVAGGAIVEAGDLLASLELKDPSKVKKITNFTGSLDLPADTHSEDYLNPLENLKKVDKKIRFILNGYEGDAEGEVLNLITALSHPDLFRYSLADAMALVGNKLPAEIESRLSGINEPGVASMIFSEFDEDPALQPIKTVLHNFDGGRLHHAIRYIAAIVDQYAETEAFFAGHSEDVAITKLVEKHSDDLVAVVASLKAHLSLKRRTKMILSLLHLVPTLPQRCDAPVLAGSATSHMLPELVETLEKLSALKGRDFGSVNLQASHMLMRRRLKPYDERLTELRDIISGKRGMVRSWGSTEPGNIKALIESPTLAVDLLPALFSDPELEIRKLSREVYVRRMYSAHTILDMDILDTGLVKWQFRFMDTAPQESPLRHGMLVVTDTLDSLRSRLEGLLSEYREDISASRGQSLVETPDPVNVFHVALTQEKNGEALVSSVECILSEYREMLMDMKMRMFNVIALVEPENPRYHTFTHCRNYCEDPLRRNMRPTFWHLLELGRLQDYNTERLPTANRDFHMYLSTSKEEEEKRNPLQFLFFRRISHSKDFMEGGCERIIGKALDALQLAMKEPKVSTSASSRIFVNVLPAFSGELDTVLQQMREILSDYIARNAPRLVRLRVDEIEIKGRVLSSGSAIAQPVRVMATSMTGKWLEVESYHEYADPINGVCKKFWNGEMCFLEPYRIASGLESRRARCRAIGTTYAYDFLGLLEKALVQIWEKAPESMPRACFTSIELVQKDGELQETQRVVGTNDVGMLAWRVTMKTPEYPEGRDVVLVANDITHMSGSFGVPEDDFFQLATEYAEERGIPRVYLSCNSGARIGLIEEIKPLFKVAWSDDSNPALGFQYLYLTKADYDSLPPGIVLCEEVNVEGEDAPRMRITDIIGQDKNIIGVENLRGSGKIAGVTSRAYKNIFTLSYVTGRSVGIGAYLCRLGQRVIQMQNGPLILTGYGALNKLLGRKVYTSQDQLGGPQVMEPNGVTHIGVEDDQQGAEQILRWLSYVPASVSAMVPMSMPVDPVDRPVAFTPTKSPYDPRNMLAGIQQADGEWISGFFDKGSFTESLGGWGKSVVCGRARLGGIPMGVIAVETRLTETRIPADPANPDSREGIAQQAGQVWFPDSAYKTAQCIEDFNNGEKLPLIIFANWRGFSGGTRDMADEILKYGAMIVDALREYDQPVFVYIPPGGELRGGAWVVIDPTINEKRMEMFADVDSRGGILEPPGVCEVKFRDADQRRAMHRLDPVLARLANGNNADEIKERETLLGPLYTQVAHEFADLHDRTGRMKAKGVISEAIVWKNSREYFYWHLRRRLAEDELFNSTTSSQLDIDRDVVTAAVKGVVTKVADWNDDKAVIRALQSEAGAIQNALKEIKKEYATKKIESILSVVPGGEQKVILGELSK